MFQFEWVKIAPIITKDSSMIVDGSEQSYIPTNKSRERHTFVEDSSSLLFKSVFPLRSSLSLT